jgi:HCOMODA/2-hydroxy-3-carboxy-muconic semialdehyde decarboxylase
MKGHPHMNQSVTTTTPESLRQELVIANRVLVGLGVLDAFGHVSARLAPGEDCFLLSRNLAPGSVTVDDLLEHDLNGNVSDGAPRPYLERFIHAEIYRSRPDVMAVVHSHSSVVVPFSTVSTALRPLIHMAGFLPAGGAPVFEISDVAGDASDMLITSSDLGRALASTLGDNSVALMRGHGSVAVGSTIAEAVYRAHYTEVNARAQAEALSIGGEPRYLSSGEAAAANETVGSQVLRAWNVWRENVQSDTAP